MKVQEYTDDGYREVQGFDSTDVTCYDIIETLYDKGLLTAEEVNAMLPSGYEVVEPEAVPENKQFKLFIDDLNQVAVCIDDEGIGGSDIVKDASERLQVADELIRKLYARNLEAMANLKPLIGREV